MHLRQTKLGISRRSPGINVGVERIAKSFLLVVFSFGECLKAGSPERRGLGKHSHKDHHILQGLIVLKQGNQPKILCPPLISTKRPREQPMKSHWRDCRCPFKGPSTLGRYVLKITSAHDTFPESLSLSRPSLWLLTKSSLPIVKSRALNGNIAGLQLWSCWL